MILKHRRLEAITPNWETQVVWKTGGSASHQRKSPRPITWVTCQVIVAWSRDAERPSFQGTWPSRRSLLGERCAFASFPGRARRGTLRSYCISHGRSWQAMHVIPTTTSDKTIPEVPLTRSRRNWIQELHHEVSHQVTIQGLAVLGRW